MGHLALLPQQAPKQLSRDEMNLAEFPLTVLSTRTNAAIKTLEFSDSVKGKNGEVLNRKWIITGADKFGLPTASDDEVLLGLLKLTVDSGFGERKVYFTRYELLKILRWSTEGRSYTRLQKALDRLSGVRIKASNGFFDNETKLHSTRNFGIIDAYEINDGRGPGIEVKPSFFIWSETIFKSFQVGFIKKLDLDFLLDLKSAVSKRLYRYLDKHFWYRARVQQNLFTLAHEKLGVSRTYSYASQLRQQLDPAIEELVERGFLMGVEYLGKGSDTEVVFYSAAGARRSAGVDHSNVVQLPERGATGSAEGRGAEQVHPQAEHLAESVQAKLVARGLRPKQALDVTAGKDESTLHRLEAIITYYDELLRQNSSKISRSPVGFLFRAVEQPERFVLPRELQPPLRRSAVRKEKAPAAVIDGRAIDGRTEAQYLTERKRILERLRSEVEPDLLAKITQDVEGALNKLRALISPSRFKDAVEHAVEEKLSRLFAIPDYEEWKRSGFV
ncbi:MAG: RepB family plasmid replication initiator protein [Proteobacteria bacterium]|nr:RepB family plasmid replication initiator protein [Pseudomonadota bacterium]